VLAERFAVPTHDCRVQLFSFLKIPPNPDHHQYLTPSVKCCEWGFDPNDD
jgi:hypothetical protein